MTLSRCISYHWIEILGLLCKRINVDENLSVSTSVSVYLMQSGRQSGRLLASSTTKRYENFIINSLRMETHNVVA